MDDDYEDLLRLATAGKESDSSKDSTAGLTAADMVDLQAIHDSVAELLKHFWMCFPPTTPEMDEKVCSKESESFVFFWVGVVLLLNFSLP